jgi:hypothetical protein
LKEALDYFLSTMPQPRRDQAESSGFGQKKTKRASPLQLFHYVRMKAAGGRWFGKESWAKSAAALDNETSPESQRAFEQLSWLPQHVAQAALCPPADKTCATADDLALCRPAPALCEKELTLPGLPVVERVSDGSEGLPLSVASWQDALSASSSKLRAKQWDNKFASPPVIEGHSQRRAPSCHQSCCKDAWSRLHSTCQACFNSIADIINQQGMFCERFPVLAIHPASVSCLASPEQSLFYLMIHAGKSPLFQILMAMEPAAPAQGEIILKPSLHQWHSVTTEGAERFPSDNHGRCKILHCYEALNEIARLGKELSVSTLQYELQPKPPWLHLRGIKVAAVFQLDKAAEYEEHIWGDEVVVAPDDRILIEFFAFVHTNVFETNAFSRAYK